MKAFLVKIGYMLLEKLIMSWVTFLSSWYQDKIKNAENKKTDEETLKEYKEAIKENKSDKEVSNATENMLNGNKP